MTRARFIVLITVLCLAVLLGSVTPAGAGRAYLDEDQIAALTSLYPTLLVDPVSLEVCFEGVALHFFLDDEWSYLLPLAEVSFFAEERDRFDLVSELYDYFVEPDEEGLVFLIDFGVERWLPLVVVFLENECPGKSGWGLKNALGAGLPPKSGQTYLNSVNVATGNLDWSYNL